MDGERHKWALKNIYPSIYLYRCESVFVYILYRWILFARTQTENESTIKWRNCSTKTSTTVLQHSKHRFLSSFCFYFECWCFFVFFPHSLVFLCHFCSSLTLGFWFLRHGMIAATHIVYRGIFSDRKRENEWETINIYTLKCAYDILTDF